MSEQFKLFLVLFFNLTTWLPDFIVWQNGMGSLFARLLDHRLDSQVVDIESRDTHIDGWVDSVICGLACFSPIPWSQITQIEMKGDER